MRGDRPYLTGLTTISSILDAILNMASKKILYLGARKREIFRARWDEDVDLNSRKFKLPTRKRKAGTLEYDWLPIGNGELYEALLRHRRNNHSKWVFPDPQTGESYTTRHRWLKQLCKKAGVRPFDIHAIRHLSASVLSRKYSIYILSGMIIHSKQSSRGGAADAAIYATEISRKLLSTEDCRAALAMTFF